MSVKQEFCSAKFFDNISDKSKQLHAYEFIQRYFIQTKTKENQSRLTLLSEL